MTSSSFQSPPDFRCGQHYRKHFCVCFHLVVTLIVTYVVYMLVRSLSMTPYFGKFVYQTTSH